MSNIVTRQTTGAGATTNKGSPLTNAEFDANFMNLNVDKMEASVKDASGGVPGLTLYKINMRNVANTFTSWLTNSNTASRTYTFKDSDGTVAFTSDITGTNSGTNTGDNAVNSSSAPAAHVGAGGAAHANVVAAGAAGFMTGADKTKLDGLITTNAGTLGLSIGAAGATNTSVTIGTGTGFNANTASNITYDIKVGPAITALTTLMTTAGAGFIRRGATADTYTIDTNVYLTAESDTLSSVTGRGSSTTSAITINNATASTVSTNGALVVTGGVGVGGAINTGGDVNVGGNAVITGNLTVNGTTTTLNSVTLSIDDKNLELGAVASPTDVTADGAGITVLGSTNKTIQWINSTGLWTFGQGLAAPHYRTNAVAGDGYGLWTGNANTYGMAMSQSADVTYGGRISGETTSDYNIYFTINNGTNRGFVFRNAYATPLFAINGDGVRAVVPAYLQAITATGAVKFENMDVRFKSNSGSTFYGVFARNDGADFYLLTTANGDANGSWNNKRPFQFGLASGTVAMQQGVNLTGGLSILATAAPGIATGTPSTSGGTMGATTTYARIVAIDLLGNTTLAGAESAGVVTTGSTASIVWVWTDIVGAISYRVYVGATGAQGNYFTTTTNSFTQTLPSSSGTALALPVTSNTGGITTAADVTIGRYGYSQYLAMSHAASGATTDTIFYSSTDNFIRKNTATGFKTSLALQNVTNESKATMFASPTITGTATIATTAVRRWTAADTDIDGLIAGSTFGSLIEGEDSGQFTVGLRSNDVDDGFHIVSKQAGNATYNKLCMSVLADGRTILGGTVQAPGYSAAWGGTNGLSTGAINAIMGVSTSATWLVSGTSAGVFRYGIQAYDLGNIMRFYAGTNYFEFNNNNLVASVFQSTVAQGTAPLTVISTTVVANLNADMVDGAHVGTSGATIPLLSTANTWGNTQNITVNSGGPALTISNAGAGVGINVDDIVVTSTVTHNGLVMGAASAGSIAVDQKYTFTASSVVLTAAGWTDSGISGATQLVTGVYMLYLQTGTNEFYTGTVPWSSINGAATLNDEFSEIILTKTGDGGTVTNVYCRILRTASGAPKLQLAASATLATYAYVLNFRRIW